MLWLDMIKRDSEAFDSFNEYLRNLRNDETSKMDTAKSFDDVLRAQGAKLLLTRIELETTAEEREAMAYAIHRSENS